MNEIETYEDVAELYAAEGWGCKCCGKLTSPSWWKGEGGDTYCLRCKKQMWNELRVRFTKYPTRAEAGVTRTVTRVYDPTSQGFEVAAAMRAEYERMYHDVIDGEIVEPRTALSA